MSEMYRAYGKTQCAGVLKVMRELCKLVGWVVLLFRGSGRAAKHRWMDIIEHRDLHNAQQVLKWSVCVCVALIYTK